MIGRPKKPAAQRVHLAGDLFGDRQEDAGRARSPASGCAGCRATSSPPGRARPRRRTSSRRRRRAARRRRCADCSFERRRAAWPPGPCPGSTGAAGRRGSRLPSKRPSRASAHRDRRSWAMRASGSRKAMRRRLWARSRRRSVRSCMSARRRPSSGSSAASAFSVSAVSMSPKLVVKPSRISSAMHSSSSCCSRSRYMRRMMQASRGPRRAKRAVCRVAAAGDRLRGCGFFAARRWSCSRPCC